MGSSNFFRKSDIEDLSIITCLKRAKDKAIGYNKIKGTPITKNELKEVILDIYTLILQRYMSERDD